MGRREASREEAAVGDGGEGVGVEDRTGLGGTEVSGCAGGEANQTY